MAWIEKRGCRDETVWDLPWISHLVGLGQSNEQGAQSMPAVSGAELGYGAIMFAGGVQTRAVINSPPLQDLAGSAVTPLTGDGDKIWTGETPAVGLISHLLHAAKFEISVDAPKFLYTYPHMGGKHLAELDWRDLETDPTNPNPGPGGYHATFVDDIRRARGLADAAGRSYGVLAFHFTQGENEGRGYLLPGGAVLPFSAFVASYKADLACAYARWDGDARAISGQQEAIPLFISQVDNFWAGQAQAQLAAESADVFVVGPIYYVPSALNSLWNGAMRGHRAHLSADGQRWRGEQAGKVMARVLREGENWRPLQPREIVRSADTAIVLRFDVPRPPLAFESGWLPMAPDYGFEVQFGTPDAPGPRLSVMDVAITNCDEITISIDPRTPLPDCESAFVTYGQALTVGVTSCPVAEIREGEFYAHGAASTELAFIGDCRAEFLPMLIEGCFLLRQIVDPATTEGHLLSASVVIRDMRLENGLTILRGETESIERRLVTGQHCSIERDRAFGNLCDSDSARSHFTFSDLNYGSRHGQPYPLQNFCLVFAHQVGWCLDDT